MFSCPYCAECNAITFKKLLRHIRFVHSCEPNFSVSCGVCNQTFRKFESFKSHLRRKHNGENDHVPLEILNGDLEQDPTSGDDSDNENDNENGQETGQESLEDMTRFIALFILKTKEENQLSQQVLNSIMDNTESLVEQSLEAYKNEIVSCLATNGIDILNIDGLNEVLEGPSLFSRAKTPLATEYLQVKYFVEKFNFVEPESIVLSQHGEYRMVRGVKKLRLVKETYQYIPLLKTLKALLNQPDVLTEIYNPHVSTDGALRDFCDGEAFKEHPLFGVTELALVLHGYYDDFQVTNALGSKTKKHKLGAFYFTVGNIRPCYRSGINTIQLFALCKVELIKKYGVNRILAPFMRDINALESDDGVTINVDGVDRVFKGSIGPFSSDNLGAHTIGGFIECFSSLRICRVCMATSDEIQYLFKEEMFQLRTREMHDRHCELVAGDPTLCPAYGVKRPSVLNQSRYFHVIGGLDLDIMHDQLEGVLPLEIKMLVRKIAKEHKLATLDDINERIENFNYGPADQKNKPSPLKQQVFSSDAASLSQTASQMWCLARMFPLMMGDLIPDNDDNWENFLRLLKIEEIVFAPSCSAELAAYLAVLVEEYLEQFTISYNRRVIPKQHFMVHYPVQIVRRGPLVQNWSMRFEAKHNYFKKLVDKVNNFKNIDYSLARRHQALQAYLLHSGGRFYNISMEKGPGKETTITDANFGDALNVFDDEITCNTKVTVMTWVKIFGTSYSTGCVIITGLYHGQPTFGEIIKVLLVMGNIIFQYKTLQVLEYSEHLNAYQVTPCYDVHFIKQDQLQDFHPLGIHQGFGNNSNKLFVVMRYVVDSLQ